MTQPSGAHTTHISIADPNGNVVAMTLTLGDDFGSGYVVPGTGVLLNNALAAFSQKLPNTVAGGSARRRRCRRRS